MYTILSIFGRSPFAPLCSHMNEVSACVHLLPPLFQALKNKDYEFVKNQGTLISSHEHAADSLKNDIRHRLPKSLYLSIDRNQLIEILALQDGIANASEDIGVLCNLKPIEILDSFIDPFFVFLDKNIETFDAVKQIIFELHELAESSFGGNEADKVRHMIDQVGIKEQEADLQQRILLKSLFASENTLSYSTFHLWQKVFEALSKISNLSETIAHRILLTLEIGK